MTENSHQSFENIDKIFLLCNYNFDREFSSVRKKGFALKKAFARTIHSTLPDLRALARSYSLLADENLKFWIFMNSRWKNGLYDIGFSQNDCFFSIPQLFIYGLYANILRD